MTTNDTKIDLINCNTESARNHLKTLEYDEQFKDRFVSAVQTWRKYFPKNLQLLLTTNNVEIPNLGGFTLDGFISHGEKISSLSSCNGFNKTIALLSNKEQLFSTLFELDCAYFILKNKSEIIEFEPEISTNNHIKRSDFRYQLTNGDYVYCECKSLNSYNRTKRCRAGKLAEYIFPIMLKTHGLENNIRIEISFSKLPNHFNRNLGAQLEAALKTMLKTGKSIIDKPIELNFTDSETAITLTICHKGTAIRSTGSIILGNKQPQCDCDVIITESMNTLFKEINRNIKDAITQLPINEHCTIMIHAPDNIEPQLRAIKKPSAISNIIIFSGSKIYEIR